MKKQEKVFAIADLAERLKNAKIVVLTDYRGLTVPQISQLRSLVKKTGGEMMVVKNTLFGRALKEVNLPELELVGPTAVVFSNADEIAALKAVSDFAKTVGLPSFKSGIWEDRVLTKEEIERLGQLPSKTELVSKLVNLMSSPTLRLVRVLTANPQKLVFILQVKAKGGD